jgi:hypothetical protein
MKRSLSPGRRLKPSEWGKLLLAASLLLVFVMGALQLYEVQSFLFPGKYHAIKLNLIRKEYFKIHQGLTSLQSQVDYLCKLQKPGGQSNLVPVDRSLTKGASARPATEAPFTPELAWPSLIHAAKKKRVYVARKLNYINMILKSMQRSLKAQLSDNSKASTQKPEMEKKLRQIPEELARWRIYHDKLDELSEKLGKLEGTNS